MGKANRKRKSGPFYDGPAEKRHRAYSPGEGGEGGHSSLNSTAYAPLNPYTGMRAAFPGLDDYNDEENGFYGPANDGVDYLRMVRCEARGVPDVLVAPEKNEEIENDPYGYNENDWGGYYEDGAYTASAELVDNIVTEEQDAQDMYYDALKLRFRVLKTRLWSKPPPLQAAQDPQLPTHWAGNEHKSYSFWRHVIRDQSPTPVQVAKMDQETVLKLLKLVTKLALKNNANVSQVVGRWIWALLARLRELECLSSDEVSIVRELGKKAVWCLVAARTKSAEGVVLEVDEYDENEEDSEEETFSNHPQEHDDGPGQYTPEDLADSKVQNTTTGEADSKGVANISNEGDLDEGEIEEDESEEDSEDEEKGQAALVAARTRLLDQISRDTEILDTEICKQQDEYPSQATRATLDMIITIAGEFYGQKDLLEFREIWDEDS